MSLISVIVPTLNEAQRIDALMRALQGLRQAGHEIIVVDGGSTDGTPGKVERHADRLITAECGRATQMNAGAAVAKGDLFWFVHADTLPSAEAIAALMELAALGRRRCWGRCMARLSAPAWPLRVVEALMEWRSRWSGIATGDQAVFVSRSLFEDVGGFPAIALMEDIALSRALKRRRRPLRVKAPVLTSSRRWEREGVVRTILLMWYLRLSFALGADPARLARRYYKRSRCD